VEVLRKEGANHILNSTEPDFEERLKELATKLNSTVCFDAIGG
jgi:NADPH:quinone reductase